MSARVNLGSIWKEPAATVGWMHTDQDGMHLTIQFLGFRLVNDDESRQVSSGGGWNRGPQRARVPLRFSNGPANRYGDLGFRLVRERS